jgi:Uma2 family endonuclease
MGHNFARMRYNMWNQLLGRRTGFATMFRLTVEQYRAMIRFGILTDDDRVELLDGLLVAKVRKTPPHVLARALLRRSLERVLPVGWHINAQDPITFDTSEPEPDISAVLGTPRDYADRHPCAPDVGLVVEIAEASAVLDCGFRTRMYARARIPVYWVISLTKLQVEVLTQPSGPAEQPDYGHRQEFGVTDTLPVVIDGQEIGRLPVAEFLS